MVSVVVVKVIDVIHKSRRRAPVIRFDVKGDFDAITFGSVKEERYSLVLA
jgi:hypothetical protein